MQQKNPWKSRQSPLFVTPADVHFIIDMSIYFMHDDSMSKKIVGSSFAPTKEPGTIHTVRRFV
jgi:hypothetical protein